MPDLREEFEAWKRTMKDGFDAWDAVLWATERAAKLVESGPPPLKLEGGRVEIGEMARNAYAAAIRAREGKGGAG